MATETTERRRRGGKAKPAAVEPPPMESFREAAWSWLSRQAEAEAQPDDPPTPAVAPQPSGDVTRAHLKGLLEALVFASDRPVPANELARSAKASRPLVKELLAELVAEYRSRGFRLEEIAGGFAFRTSATYSPFVRDLAMKKPVRMSRALVETLAIVAYRQPITRPEIDDVRGVDSGPVLKTLLERELVRILGKKDEPGRPMLYGTTSHFLEFFGLKSLNDLPTLREFTELSDDSKRTFERELGEEPPEPGEATAVGEGFAGGEGALSAVAAPPEGDAPVDAEPPQPSEEAASEGEAEDEGEDEDEDEGEDDDEDEDEGEDEDEDD